MIFFSWAFYYSKTVVFLAAVSIFMNVMYELAEEECAKSAKKYFTDWKKNTFWNKKFQNNSGTKKSLNTHEWKKHLKCWAKKGRKLHILQKSERCCWLSLLGQRESVQMLPPAVLSHHSLLTVFISHSANILKKTLEMQASSSPSSKKIKQKTKQKFSVRVHRA